MTAVPTFETDRFFLRGLRRDDFEPFAESCASGASRFVGGPREFLATINGDYAA